MANDEEKTEEPTQKKIEDAKKDGNVSKSMEVVGAAILTLGSIYLIFFSGYMINQIKGIMLHSYSFIGQEINSKLYYTLALTSVSSALISLAPLFVLVLILVFTFNWVQFGMLATPLKFKFEKLNPISGLKNLISLKKAIEALKLMLKLIIIFCVMVVLFLMLGESILAMMDKSLFHSLENIVFLIILFLSTILFIIIVFAIIDFFFTRHFYMKSLRMSKQDIKDEYKNMEGDPQVKGRIRSIQMRMAMKRMMKEVPDADVVITNPTHYAVAMKYDNMKNSAPMVVAKGVDFIALKIRDLAKEHNIPIIENPPLARALVEQLDVDQEIPNEFYKACAEIFSYVYELKKKRLK